MTSNPPLQHIHSVPYTNPPSRLRTLDIWLPRTHEAATTTPSTLPWIIYIHGGAWRDPLKTASDIAPTLHHLVASHPATLSRIGGIASLNYRLSPYPTHATQPSDPDDPDRNVQHPQHLRDVVRALRHLRREQRVRRWVGVGHSCGATLLLQLVSRIGLDEDADDDDDDDDDNALGSSSSSAPPPPPPTAAATTQGMHTLPSGGGPEALLLLAGIYDLPLLLQNHAVPACAEPVARVYDAFVAGAFGADRERYACVSPVAGRFGPERWPEGRLVVLGHSHEDELVEGAQRDVMCVALAREGWSVGAEGRRALEVRELKGAHDFLWRDGRQVAQLIAEVILRLS